MSRIKVWDIPTRMFHWLLVLTFSGAYATSFSPTLMVWHACFGVAILSLIIFRIYWGFKGTQYARFKTFLFSRAAISKYVKALMGHKKMHLHTAGHNPVGSLGIFTLLFLCIVIPVTGLVEYFGFGHKYNIVIHEYGTYVILACIAIHIFGALSSSIIHHENLVASMITGYKRKRNRKQSPITNDHKKTGIVLLIAVVASAVACYFFITLYWITV